ncbi:hypothetical protein VVD49_05445 [Uliginosibacterium sp. H3]|uniref:Solute-binding protein family 3/N-terminal domain-containing protein n=1 Tax=Uliginosibacterium silvisoli TaxID=3114758 RepID=A0ABU6JZP5_9RHOO|nr:hypothetical protein [Uliginosibacterium sp. H3]
MLRKLFALLLVMSGLTTLPCTAADITLRLAAGTTGNHRYYHALLTEALKAAGHKVTVEVYENLPQTRILAYLDIDRLTAHWMLQTPERDTLYTRVDFPLTQGLIGQRVLFVPKGTEGIYANVKDLAQFRELGKTAGLGKGWFDVSIWEANKLSYVEQAGEWRQLFSMLAAQNRGVDYFPRGASEIGAEALLHPELAIEPNLLLVYQRDFVFYLSRGNAHLKPVMEAALRQAEKSGLQKRLMEEHFGSALQQLNLDKRVRLKLLTP